MGTINVDEFKKVFGSIFIGVGEDIYEQIFDGFDTLNVGKMDYYQLLTDSKLPKILLLLHNNAMNKISTLQNETNDNDGMNMLSSPTTNGGCNGGETPDPDDDDIAIAQNFNFNHFDPSCTVFEIVDGLKDEKQHLLNINDKLREELFDK